MWELFLDTINYYKYCAFVGLCCKYVQNTWCKHFQDDDRIFAGYKFVICPLIVCNKVKGSVIIVHAIEVLGKWKHLFIYSFIRSYLPQDGVEWSASANGRRVPGVRTLGTGRMRGCVGPRAGLDSLNMRKICLLRESNYDSSVVHPVASSLYIIHYPNYD